MPMAPRTRKCTKREVKGAWTPEEDERLGRIIKIHGPKRWKAIATKAGLNRCGKSCRLRWMNYLRPNIKRGNISEQEEDLILRLHKLLGNRWSLIAGRLPGRTDNEIKNYWNSHLCKKTKQNEKQNGGLSIIQKSAVGYLEVSEQMGTITKSTFEERRGNAEYSSAGDEMFDFCNNNPLDLEWMSRILEMDDNSYNLLQ